MESDRVISHPALRNQIELRLAQPGDAPTISSLLLESFAEYRSLYTDGGFGATTPNAAAVRDRMREGPVWVAVSKEATIGTVSAVLKGKSLYIRGMAVLPSARGQRVGQALLERVEEYAASRNCVRLFLS